MGVRRRLTAALSVGVAASAALSGPADARPSPAWRLASIPQTTMTSVLRDVAAADSAHAWAVGVEGYDPAQQYTTGDPLILKWNGIGWSRSSVPAVQGKVSLQHVAASSVNNVWVTGSLMAHDPGDNTTFVYRYDGSAWTRVPYPAGATPSTLSIRDLSVVDGRAWLVGYRDNRPVFHEWTGQAWVEHEAPAECVNGGGIVNFCTVNAVKAFAPDDVWAAGNGMWNGFAGPLLFHWNGTAWRAVQVGVNQQMTFQSLDGRSSKDIWAVGDAGGMGSGSLVVRGDGTTWQQVGGLNASRVPGVAVSRSGTPWVIGNLMPQAAFNTYTSGAWVTTPAPPYGSGTAYNAIAAVPGTDRVFAVGYTDVPGTSPLRLRAVIASYSIW